MNIKNYSSGKRIPILRSIIILLLSAVISRPAIAQTTDSAHYITMPASAKYHKSAGYQKRWGVHYRPEWHTPVTFKKVNLDTLAGGLTPYQLGGGRQSRSVRLHDANDHEYVLRSIDKSYGK